MTALRRNRSLRHREPEPESVFPPEPAAPVAAGRWTTARRWSSSQPYVAPVAQQGYVPPPAEQEYVAPVAAATTVPPPSQPTNVNVAPQQTYVDSGPGGMYYARRIVSLLYGILATLLVIRIFLLLLVANQQNAIVDFVYSVTEPFVAPFRGMFALDAVSPGGASVFDVAALVALIAWTLIYALIMAILRIGDRR